MEPRPITGAARPSLRPGGPSSGGRGGRAPPPAAARAALGSVAGRSVGFWGAGGGFGVAAASLPPSSQLVTGSTGACCPCSQRRPRAWSHRRAPLLPTAGLGGKTHGPTLALAPFARQHGQGLGARGCPWLAAAPRGGQALPDVRTAGRCRARVPLAARVWAPVGPPLASVARGWLRGTGAPSPINLTLYFYNQQRVAGCVLPTPSPKVLEHPGVALGSLGCILGEQTAPAQPPASSLPLLIPILQQEGLGCRDEPQRPIPTRGWGEDTEAVSRRLHPRGTMRVGWDLGICPRAQGRWQEGPAGFPAAGRWRGRVAPSEDVSRASTRQRRAV